jgi:hypothetical protein
MKFGKGGKLKIFPIYWRSNSTAEILQYEWRLWFMLENRLSNWVVFTFTSLCSSKESGLAGTVQRQRSASITTMTSPHPACLITVVPIWICNFKLQFFLITCYSLSIVSCGWTHYPTNLYTGQYYNFSSNFTGIHIYATYTCPSKVNAKSW